MARDEIKAIPTKYKGINFRSRLEARWAVFFDSMFIKWEYEKEGYQLKSGWYLPDFWLPEMKIWVEVKPEGFECQHACCLRDEVGYPVLVTGGLPDSPGTIYCNDDSDSSAGSSEHKTCKWMWYGQTVIVVEDCRNRLYCNADYSICDSIVGSDGDLEGNGHLSLHHFYESSVQKAKQYQFNY